MIDAGKSVTAMMTYEAKPATDGETLSFLTATFERLIAAEYRQMWTDRLGELEARLWKVDCALTACPKCDAIDGLADMIDELHACLTGLVPSGVASGFS